MTILVAGATGNVGGELVSALLRAGEPVRALIRREAARTMVPEGVEAVLGDLNHPASLREGLAGAEAVFLLSGYADMPATLEEIHRAGAERVVLLSSSAVPGGDMDNAVARYHILSERAVRDSGLPWTFLQPNSFMSGTLQWASQLRGGDVVRAPFGNVRVATIDPWDVAAVAAEALTSATHEGRTYRLSGPDSLLPADRVAVLAEVLERDLRFEAQSDAEAEAEMIDAMPREYVDAFFSFFADGALDESQVLPSVEEVIGTPPRSFEAWALAHAGAFSTQAGA